MASDPRALGERLAELDAACLEKLRFAWAATAMASVFVPVSCYLAAESAAAAARPLAFALACSLGVLSALAALAGGMWISRSAGASGELRALRSLWIDHGRKLDRRTVEFIERRAAAASRPTALGDALAESELSRALQQLRR